MNVKNNKDEVYLGELIEKVSQEHSYENVLSSMCTPPKDILRKIAGIFAEINLGDPGLFPNSAQLENEVLLEIAKLLHAPKTWTGSVTSGGSESNVIGCWAARNWSKKFKAIKNGKLLLPKSAHISFEKAADLLDVQIEWIPLNERHQVDIEKLKEKINKKTIGIIGIAGSTGTGACDDIKAISDLVVDHNIYLHVDAAFGGMIFPFLKPLNYPSPDFDFSNEGVTSITIDTHKILGGLIPGGDIIFRSNEYSDTISKTISYLSDSNTKQLTITGTRPGVSVLGSWFLIKNLGWNYLSNRVKSCMEMTEYIIIKLTEIPTIKLAFTPTINIIAFTHSKISSQKLKEKLKGYGWKISIYYNWLRIVVMPHFTKKMVDKFISNLKEIIMEEK